MSLYNLAIALSLSAVTATLAACSDTDVKGIAQALQTLQDGQQDTTRQLALLNTALASSAAANSPAPIADAVLVETSVAADPSPAIVLAPSSSSPPAPPPPPPPNEYQIWQTDPAYVCTPQFRIKSCTDSGEPVWLDANMNWLPFGVVP